MSEKLHKDPRLTLFQQLKVWVSQDKVPLDQAVELLYEEYHSWEKAQNMADTERMYNELRDRFGEWTVGIGIDDQGNFPIAAFERLKAAYYTGLAQSCLAVCIYDNNVGCGAAHYNTLAPSAIKRRLSQLLMMDHQQGKQLSQNEGILIAQGQRDLLLLSQTTPSERAQTADYTLKAAMTQYTKLPGSRNHIRSAHIRAIGIFYLPSPENHVIERSTQQTLKAHGFNPNNLEMRLGQEGGFMYGPYNKHFSTPRFYP